MFEWNRIDLPQRCRRTAKRKVRAQAWFRTRRSPWRAMEISEKARIQKKAALVATKRSIGGTSEWQFGEMRDSLIAWKILKEKVGDQKQLQRVLMHSHKSLLIVYLFLGFDLGNGLNRTSSESFSKFTTSVFLPEYKNPESKLAHLYVLPPGSKMHVLKAAEWYIEQRSKTISRHFAGSC